MARLAIWLRAAALMAVGALAMHELRFAAYSGGHADERAVEARHEHIELAVLVVGAVAAAALGAFLWRLGRARRDGRAEPVRRLRPLAIWPLATAGLLAIYLGQEALEIALASQDAASLADLLGHGGWIAVPLAVAIGGLVALVCRGATALVAIVARGGRALRRRRRRPAVRRHHTVARRHRPDPLAESVGGRGPPAPSLRPQPSLLVV